MPSYQPLKKIQDPATRKRTTEKLLQLPLWVELKVDFSDQYLERLLKETP